MTDTTFVSVIDGHHITFDIKKATFDNGFVMAGDSCEIHYIGALSDDPVKVVLIKLIPKKGHVVNAVYNPNKKLETAPMSPEEQKSLDEGVDFAKHLSISPFRYTLSSGEARCLEAEEFRSGQNRHFRIYYICLPDFVLTLAVE